MAHSVVDNDTKTLGELKERVQNVHYEYFSIYENPHWKPETIYERLRKFVLRLFYFISGPKFIVPILRICSKI